MSLILIIIAAALVPLAVYLWTRQKSELEKRVDRAMSDGLNRWSPRYADVARERDVAVTLEHLTAIDTGLAEVFERARSKGYTRHLEQSLYTFVFLMGESFKGVNVFRMPDGDYVAGIVVDLDKRIIAIPEHKPDQTAELAQIVGYEAEHCILYANDRDLFERTKTHAPGEGHPIF